MPPGQRRFRFRWMPLFASVDPESLHALLENCIERFVALRKCTASGNAFAAFLGRDIMCLPEPLAVRLRREREPSQKLQTDHGDGFRTDRFPAAWHLADPQGTNGPGLEARLELHQPALGAPFGMVMPHKPNPGSWVSCVCFTAPVCDSEVTFSFRSTERRLTSTIAVQSPMTSRFPDFESSP